MKGYFELEQKRFEIEEDIKNKQKQIKKLEKDKEKEIKQNSNSVFSLDARLDVIELKYAERFNIYNNELQHLKDTLKLINYCINVVFY